MMGRNKHVEHPDHYAHGEIECIDALRSALGRTGFLGLIADGRIGRLVITDKDRLLRFGAELVLVACNLSNSMLNCCIISTI